MKNVRVEDIPINDRPRERLINEGVSSLSNEELLSILLGSGTREVSVKNLSMLIISKANGINNLKKLSFNDLLNIKGVGKAKACIILALCELSFRMNRLFDTLSGLKLSSPDIVFDFYKNKIDMYQEQFYCIYLDAKKRVIKDKLLFQGTVNHSLVHPRDILKEALSLNAAFLMCMHNHPSGDVNPSVDDILVTNRIKDACLLVGIKLTDHIILSNGAYYSFLENGKI